MQDLAFFTLILSHLVTASVCYRALKTKWAYEQLIDAIRTELWRHTIAYDEEEHP